MSAQASALFAKFPDADWREQIRMPAADGTGSTKVDWEVELHAWSWALAA